MCNEICMRNSCLQQSPPAASSARPFSSKQESQRSWSPTFVHLGARSAPPGLLAELWLQRVPESPCFLTDISRESPSQSRSCGFGGSARLNCRPSCPSRLRGGRRARPARPTESPGSGGSGGPGMRPRCGVACSEARPRGSAAQWGGPGVTAR